MFNTLKLNKNIFFYILISIVLLLGIFLRLYVYIKNIPFWHDERLLGLHFFDTNIFDFFKSINPLIKIPPLWGILNKIIINIFGYSFWVCRLLSFIAGILSLIAFLILLIQVFKNKIAIFTGTLLFSFSPLLIYYSADFRPYSIDVFICILLLLSYKSIKLKDMSRKQIYLCTLIAIVLVLFSFPSIFLIFSIIIAKNIEEKQINYKCIWILLGVCITCLYLFLIDISCYKFMTTYWSHQQVAFLEPNIKSFNNIINNLYSYIFFAKYNYCEILKWMGVSGLIFLFAEKSKYSVLYFLIIIISMIASLLKIYPFGYRVSLYLIPVIFILIIKNIEFPIYINLKNEISKKILIFLKSLIISLIILFCAKTKFPQDFYSLMEKYTESKQRRYEIMNFSKAFIEKMDEDCIILCPITIKESILFYNKYLKYNKKIKSIKNYNNSDNKEKDEKMMIRNVLNKEGNIKILGMFNSWDISGNNINIAEDELNKQNLKYKKITDKNFYYFDVNK